MTSIYETINEANSPRVDILLSTYNGGKYLADQLTSIVGQTHSEWRVIIRDDISTDDTLEIIERFQADYPGRFIMTSDESVNLGAARSYSRLLEKADSDIVMFCDQDDIWHSEKLAKQVEQLAKAEEEFGSELPMLSICGLSVTNEDMTRTLGNFYDLSGFRPDQPRTSSLIIQNIAPGCCMAMNRALVERSRPMPDSIVMHDWWVILVAAVFGRVLYQPDDLVEYRRHGATVTEVNSSVLNLSGAVRKLRRYRGQLARLSRQSSDFVNSFGDAGEWTDMFADFGRIGSMGFLERRLTLYKYGIRKNTTLKTLLTYLLI